MKLVPITTQSFFKRATSVAEHYGFRSIDDLSPRPTTSPQTGGGKNDNPTTSGQHEHRVDYSVLPAALRAYAERAELRKRDTTMFYSPSVVSHPSTPATKISAMTLSSVGVQDALSEIVLLKSVTSILAELGIKQYMVRINSIGDSDSSTRFVREITSQLRQKSRDFSPEIESMLRSNPSACVSHLYEQRHPVTTTLPGPIDFLTAPSRKYFKEVLELLEHSDIPFMLDDKLYGSHRTYCHTVFEVIEPPTDSADENVTILARGGRYDNLTRTYTRAGVPAVGIVLAVQTKDMGEYVTQSRRKKPTTCLVHIGREARVASINIVEQFRREKIPIEQCFQFERFTEQLAYAEAHNMKYVIIIGQREAHQGIAIVRNSTDRSQHNVPFEQLTTYLRNVSTL